MIWKLISKCIVCNFCWKWIYLLETTFRKWLWFFVRYSETTYQWSNYCHRDAHYIIYYKSVHISGITLHSIPNLFAKLIFDSLMISNKESTRSIRTNIQNSFLKQKTYKSASTAILSRKRNHDSWLQCNESSKTNIYIYIHTQRGIFSSLYLDPAADVCFHSFPAGSPTRN